MRRYNLINNSLGWLCFVVAATTYLLTLEPTASFWDCPEYIIQGQNLEIGHPPGNPIWMLAARFFINFAGGDPADSAIAVNVMSALFSAATILLLFWTITHLVKRLIVKDDAVEISWERMVVIFGSGLCGALAYTWSDTFWFSAVEGEVYAFSSFCTALVFWLILKWENRADSPDSDRYLILIAFIMGVSIAVHLLNLLCIPAIVLVFYYRKFKNANATGSLIALAISFVIVGLVLYGLVPGFMEIAQYFELLAVNVLGWGYNSGAAVYVALLLAVMIWSIYELRARRSGLLIKISIVLVSLMSGIFFIGDSLWIPAILTAGLIIYLILCRRLPIRVLSVSIISVLVIFVGYSAYTLILIRANANTPMNQNAPDNVFNLASYMGREQYGGNGLFYDVTFADSIMTRPDSTKVFKSMPAYLRDEKGNLLKTYGKPRYAKVVKTSPDDPDRYVIRGYDTEYEMIPELKVPFPRLNSPTAIDIVRYKEAMDYHSADGVKKTVTTHIYSDGTKRTAEVYAPSYWDNIAYFLNYQLGYMYWRYFMWNFSGRQNDLKGGGELNRGNWVSGIPAIDNARLGDQSLLPDEFGEGNKGHNVYYMLPLLLGIIGLLWQAYVSQRGIEQFWIVTFLFFMTGIAIVLYLNQTVGQPRERDYAYVGSFYAFAIWMGFGVTAIWSMIKNAGIYLEKKLRRDFSVVAKVAVMASILAGLAVPLQMVSQTWDDHDRSGRYLARDYGLNYLSSLDENAIIFTEGDNELFPLWYAQEVEGYRTDVKVVNLSYLSSEWYVNQMYNPTYEASAIKTYATPGDYAYGRLSYSAFPQYYRCPELAVYDEIDACSALEYVYSDSAYSKIAGRRVFPYMNVYIPYNKQLALASGRLTAEDAQLAVDRLRLNLTNPADKRAGMRLRDVMILDIIANSMEQGAARPVYFAMPVGKEYHLGLTPYLRNTGMAQELTPFYNATYSTDSLVATDTDKMYHVVTRLYRWGGFEKFNDSDDVYIDETTRNMVYTTRLSVYNLASALCDEAEAAADEAYRVDRLNKAREVLALMNSKISPEVINYRACFGSAIAGLYIKLGTPADLKLARELIADEMRRYAGYVRYLNSLSERQRGIIRLSDWYSIPEIVYLAKLYERAGGDVAALLRQMRSSGLDLSPLPGLLDDYYDRFPVDEDDKTSKLIEIEGSQPRLEQLLNTI